MSVYIDEWGGEIDAAGWSKVSSEWIEKRTGGVVTRQRIRRGPLPKDRSTRSRVRTSSAAGPRSTLNPATLLRHARPADIELRADRLSPIAVDLRCGRNRIVEEVLDFARDGDGGVETGGYLYGRRFRKRCSRLDGPTEIEWLDVEFVAYPGPETKRGESAAELDSAYAYSLERSPNLRRQGLRLLGDYHSHPTHHPEDGKPSRGDLRGWLRSLQYLADKSDPPAWRLGSETSLDCWLGVVVTRSEGGSWGFPALHAWVTRVDRGGIVCEPAALEVA